MSQWCVEHDLRIAILCFAAVWMCEVFNINTKVVTFILDASGSALLS